MKKDPPFQPDDLYSAIGQKIECQPIDQRPPLNCPTNGPLSPIGVAGVIKTLIPPVVKVLGASSTVSNSFSAAGQLPELLK